MGELHVIIELESNEQKFTEFDDLIERKINQTTFNINHLEKFEFNTVVSDLMKLNNELTNYLKEVNEIPLN